MTESDFKRAGEIKALISELHKSIKQAKELIVVSELPYGLGPVCLRVWSDAKGRDLVYQFPHGLLYLKDFLSNQITNCEGYIDTLNKEFSKL